MSTKTRLWALVTGLLGVLVILYGIVVGLLPELQHASQIRAESETTEFLIETQQSQLARLEQADSESAALERQLAELEKSIPTSPDSAEFLRQLQSIQQSTGAVATQIEVQPGVLPEPAAEELAAGVDDAADGVEDSATPAEGVADAPAVPVTSLIQIPLTITVSGEEGQIAEFARQLQVGARLFTATSVDIDMKGQSPRGTITGLIYVTP